jgi:hypothetical protein
MRLDFLLKNGWNPKHVAKFDAAVAKPLEAAALLLAMREHLDIHHPQTILAELSRVRRTMPSTRASKRRDRPPKSK